MHLIGFKSTSFEVEAGTNLTISVTILDDDDEGINIFDYVPLTEISWTLPGTAAVINKTVLPELPAREGPLNSSLHVFSLSLEDSGIYSVEVINAEGQTTILNFTLTVRLPSKLYYTVQCIVPAMEIK